MKILAIETSSSTLSVAVNIDGKTVCEYFYNAGMIHSEVLISVIDEILKNVNLTVKDIDKFAVSSGPGSFTGIRVGMTVVKTLAQSLNKKIVSLNCLDILQNTVNIPSVKIVPAIDALRNELYVKTLRGAGIITINEFINKYKKYKNKIIIIGNAAVVHKKILSEQLGKISICLNKNMHYPKASVLAELALNKAGTDFLHVQPLYVRKSWAEEKNKK